ncbi:hypothetical protein [Halobacillus salinus]|uniref:Uncharacterized protein n=1 Tax=Halobacillus salinus TaxID=192814 RepID=A0A4Z0GXG8_9BACI|nr:hypothetical protein [Halobacillus salinus]TGB02490.1 hypothetical protein E4663_14230 [Halobacillus salinus]
MVPAVLILVAIIFSILPLNVLSFLFMIAGLLLFGVSTVALVFLIHDLKNDDKGLDVFYGLVITNVSMAIIYVLVGMSAMENIIEQFRYSPFGTFF